MPLVLLVPVLLAVGYFDMRYMLIPNRLVLLSLTLFGLCAFLLPTDELVTRLMVGFGVLLFGFVAFALNLFGGGDVKMLACLALFIPATTYPAFFQLFAVALAFGMLAVLAIRRMPGAESSSWRGLNEKRGFPMGVSIALAGILHPFTLVTASGL
jgi:prepilin peptidase CpaA